MPPLDSSNISLDTLTGRNESVGFADYLNSEHHHKHCYHSFISNITVAEDSEVTIDGHAVMQKRLKMF